MFTKPIDEINFEDVKNFCDMWGEGFRVEYKREINDYKKHIPKIVSSFANYQGGTLIIGVVCDRKKNVVKSIDGIPSKNDIEEQIRHIALTHIYHPIMPAIKIVGMPNSDNVVVVVYVDESEHAPHTINSKSEVYIRSGNICFPYDLADIDRIEYMFKRREDSQVVSKQILDRIEERANILLERRYHSPYKHFLTISTQPIFSYRPIISPSEIYTLNCSPNNDRQTRVDGGVCYFRSDDIFQLNEYGIASYSVILPVHDKSERSIRFGDLLVEMNNYLESITGYYHHSEYLGNLEVKMRLQNADGYSMADFTYHGKNIIDNQTLTLRCSDLDIVVRQRCLPHDLKSRAKRIDIVEGLIGKILWAFDIPIDDQIVSGQVRKRIEETIKLDFLLN